MLAREHEEARSARALAKSRAFAILIGTRDTRATEMVKIAQRSLVSKIRYVFSTIST
jgi:hypothetical protein